MHNDALWVCAGPAPYGGPRGSSCRGGEVPVMMQYKFQQSVLIDNGSASPSVHRQSVGHYSYDTETTVVFVCCCFSLVVLPSVCLGRRRNATTSRLSTARSSQCWWRQLECLCGGHASGGDPLPSLSVSDCRFWNDYAAGFNLGVEVFSAVKRRLPSLCA